MTVFYQQSGKRGEIDFIKTLVDGTGALRHFTVEGLKNEFGFSSLAQTPTVNLDGKSFQIWGVPAGARNVIKLMQNGDLVLLIGQLSPKALEYGKFFYAGKVIKIVQEEDFSLSSKLWGEGGFPLIFFMQGNQIEYSWLEFTRDFGFKPGYFEAGQIKRLLDERVQASRFGSEQEFGRFLTLGTQELGFADSQDGFGTEYLEGSETLRTHEVFERSSSLVNAFKDGLASLACSICEFDFEREYGNVGKGYVEAHHVHRLADGARASTASDLIAVCANCHKMLHRNWPNTTPELLRRLIKRLT